MAVKREEWRNLAAPNRPGPPEQFLDQQTRDSVWKPLIVDPTKISADPLEEFRPYAEEDVCPEHEGRPTWPKRDRMHRMAEDLLDWDITSITFFRLKLDLAALAFRDYDPDNKKQNLLRYMQLAVIFQWEYEYDEQTDAYERIKYRFRMGNHKLRLDVIPASEATSFRMRWTWRPTNHLHFTLVTKPATEDTSSPLAYRTYFAKEAWRPPIFRQHTEVIVNYAYPSFRLSAAFEFSQDCTTLTYMHMVHPRLVVGLEAKHARRQRTPFPLGFLKPRPMLTLILRYFSWTHLFQLVTDWNYQYGAVQLRATYVKDLSAVPQLHVFPRYERFLVGGALWSNIYPSSLKGIYSGSYFAMGYSYTNYWSAYNVRSVIDSEWNSKSEMSTSWMPNIDLTLQLYSSAIRREEGVKDWPAGRRVGWSVGITWFT